MGVTIVGNTATFVGTGTLTQTYVQGINFTGITIVIITGYTVIGYFAFNGLNSLTSISIPDSVTAIEYYAFFNCTGLTSVSIPDNSRLISIGYSAFNNCRMTSISIPASVQTIDGNAFYACPFLTSVSIAKNSHLISIVGTAFQECRALRTVYIQNGLLGITSPGPGSGYFFGSSNVVNFLLPITAPSISNFSITNKTFGDVPFTITAPTSNSTGGFTYESLNTSVATINGSTGTITIVGVGQATITATQAATDNYLSGTIQTTFTVTEGNPSLRDFSISSKTYGDAPFPITQPTSNNTTVGFTYTSDNLSVATINGNIITIVGPGQATITATQAATANYLSGTIQTTLLVNQSTQTNPTNIGSAGALEYFLNSTTAKYANIASTLQISTNLQSLMSEKKLFTTQNNVKISHS